MRRVNHNDDILQQQYNYVAFNWVEYLPKEALPIPPPPCWVQYRFPSLIQPLNSSLTHYSLALRYRGGTGTITQWIDKWNYWNDIGHTIPLHAGNRRAPEKSLNSGDFFLIMNSASTNIEINI